MVRLAKLVLCLFSLLGAAFFFFAVPVGGWLVWREYPDMRMYAAAWQVFMALPVFPCAVSMVNAWKIAGTLGKPADNRQKNLRRFVRAAVAAVATAVYFCGGCAALYALGLWHPSVYPVGIPAAFFGVMLTAVGCLIAYAARSL